MEQKNYFQNMKKFLFVVVCLELFASGAFARPAFPSAKCVPQDDSTCVTVQEFGDEHYHYMTTMDGYLVSYDSASKLVYADSNGEPSAIRAKNADKRSSTEKKFLNNLDQRRVLDKHKMKNGGRFPEQDVVIPGLRSRESVNAKVLMRPKALGFTMGEAKFPVFLVSTSDRTFENTEMYDDFFNKVGYSEDGHHGSVHDYFIESSNGLFSPTFDVVPVKIDLAASKAGSDEGAFVKAVLDGAAKSMDLSKYDKDGDKVVDGFGIILAGTESGSGLWGHMYQYSVFTQSFGWGGRQNNSNNYNGYKFNRYLIISQMSDPEATLKSFVSGIGVFIHEFSHVLGLPDFYSQLEGGPFIEGPTPYDIMTQGMYNGWNSKRNAYGRCPPKYSAFERESVGWMTIPELEATDGVLALPIIDKNKAYGISNPKNKDEYYVVEYRPRTGFDSGIPSSNAMGVLVWYINYDAKAWEYFPNQNQSSPRYKLDKVLTFKSGKESYDSFGGFRNVGVYNAVKEGDSIVCFVTDKSKTANCADVVVEVSSSSKDSSAVSSSSISSSSLKNVESSSSAKKLESSGSVNDLSSSSAKKISISSESDGLLHNMERLAKIHVSNGMLYVGVSAEGLKKLEIVDVLGHAVKSVEFASSSMNISLSELGPAQTLILRLSVNGKVAFNRVIMAK